MGKHMNHCRYLGVVACLLGAFSACAGEAGGEAQKKPGRGGGPPPDVADQSYGSNPQNVLDLWLAKSEKPAPLLVFIHGGGFMSGTKKAYPGAQLQAALASGISYASVEYRLSDVAQYPAQMHDCARAIQFLRQNAEKWKLDPTRIAATGGSAGAGISQWLCFHDDLADPKSQDPVLKQSTRVQAAVVTAAQCSYDPREIKKIVPGRAYDHVALKLLFGVPRDTNWDTFSVDAKLDALMKDASPITHLTKDDGPVFVLHRAVNDKEGDIHNANFGKHLKAEMDKLGLECIRRMDTDYNAADEKSWEQESNEFLKKVFGIK